jgi:hypothetical protein
MKIENKRSAHESMCVMIEEKKERRAEELIDNFA